MRSRQDVQGRQGKAGGNGDETQLLQFSTAKNVNRRHLTESQRAMTRPRWRTWGGEGRKR